MGQTHSASGRRYPWPGFIIFQREWLADRPVNFFGYRARDLRDNGDTGSMNFGLFTDEDWQRLPALHHEYVAVREGHSAYLQDWGYERIGDFIHLTNASDWMEIQNPDERHALLRGVVESL
jgi:hypothetical protein